MRKISVGAILALSVATVLAAGGARAATSAVACEITGSASLTPGVTVTPHSTSYTFTGSLKSCRSTDSTVKSGTVSAKGSGNLGCVGGTSKGTATVTWNNGKTSSIGFSTADAGSLVAVTGKTTGGEFAGDQIAGALNFITTAATKCVSGGITSLNFTGVVAGL